MPMLEWNDSLSIRVAEVDAQHKALVDMVNHLHDSMRGAASGEALLGIVNDMRRYSEDHFTTEERLMDQYGYPDPSGHKKEHADFIAKVAQVESDCKAGKASLSMDILNFLCNWLVTHIDGEDKKMGQHLVSQGAS